MSFTKVGFGLFWVETSMAKRLQAFQSKEEKVFQADGQGRNREDLFWEQNHDIGMLKCG